jgi:hypothetical protein
MPWFSKTRESVTNPALHLLIERPKPNNQPVAFIDIPEHQWLVFHKSKPMYSTWRDPYPFAALFDNKDIESGPKSFALPIEVVYSRLQEISSGSWGESWKLFGAAGVKQCKATAKYLGDHPDDFKCRFYHREQKHINKIKDPELKIDNEDILGGIRNMGAIIKA